MSSNTEVSVPKSANVRMPPPVYGLAGLLIGFGHDLLIQVIPRLPVLFRPIGAVLLVAGGVIASAGLLALYRAGTAIDPRKRTTVLLTSGIYRWTRNPSYLGLALGHAGIALLGRSTAALLLLPVVVVCLSTLVIRAEESYLHTIFGTQYEKYRASVRRWL